MTDQRNNDQFLFGLIMATVVAVGLAPFLGQIHIPFWSVLEGKLSPRDYDIFWNIRTPRVVLAFFAGAGLSLCGMVFQAMFRNFLASPFTLGISSGASLGAAIYIKLGLAFSLMGITGSSLFAFLGALSSTLIILLIAKRLREFSTTSMLLGGVVISFFFSSLIIFMQYLSDFTEVFKLTRWLMGSLSVLGYDLVYLIAGTALLGFLIVISLTRELDLLSIDSDLAKSRGVDVNRTCAVLFAVSSLVVGCIVSICGIIGFAGIVVPYICRSLVGYNHRLLTPASFVFGGVFLVFCDTLARTMIAPSEIPVGVITALLGGPFFLWLLFSKPTYLVLD